MRMKDKDLNKRLKDFSPEQSINISFFRRDKLMTKTMILASAPKNSLTIIPVKKVTKQQKAFFKAWTGVDFPKANR